MQSKDIPARFTSGGIENRYCDPRTLAEPQEHASFTALYPEAHEICKARAMHRACMKVYGSYLTYSPSVAHFLCLEFYQAYYETERANLKLQGPFIYLNAK